MGYFEVLPHRHVTQGWVGAVKHRDQEPVVRGGVGDYREAVARAAEHGVRLRIPLDVRQQMEHAGCAPEQWPADLAQ